MCIPPFLYIFSLIPTQPSITCSTIGSWGGGGGGTWVQRAQPGASYQCRALHNYNYLSANIDEHDNIIYVQVWLLWFKLGYAATPFRDTIHGSLCPVRSAGEALVCPPRTHQSRNNGGKQNGLTSVVSVWFQSIKTTNYTITKC